MKIRLLSIGKTRQPFVSEGIGFYTKRLVRYNFFEMVELPDEKGKHPKQAQKRKEGARLLGRIEPGATLVALDENGRKMNSEALAKWLQGCMNRGARHLDFLVGGAYGHSEEVLKRADLKLSLSDLTFPHDLVRLIFVEQLYRAFSILRGEPYHHG